jgi:hypothetical protein
MLETLADINAAFDAGRMHTQRFLKNAGTATALQWADATFASGQPAYDAHVGTPLAFTPCVAARNDSITLPIGATSIALTELDVWSNQATYNGPLSLVLFDLVGFYPLIDGDSTDLQPMDNTQTLPRNADGKGLVAVVVNHVAPGVQTGQSVIEYIDATGALRTATLGLPNNGVNLVCSGATNTLGLDVGNYAMSLPGGVRRIESIQHLTAPGGLHCIYLIRPIGSVVCGDNLVTTNKQFIPQNGFAVPLLQSGAWLGWFYRIGAGTARQVSFFGQMTFAWE